MSRYLGNVGSNLVAVPPRRDTAAVTEAEPLGVQEFVVALDYGQFALHTADPDLGDEVLEEALAGEGIAQRDGMLVVCSPHLNNFEMPLRVKLWPTIPLT